MLFICEGLDRVGKSTVASYYESLGYQVIHMSAPAKHHTSDSFFEKMMQIVLSASTKDIFLDRSYYGEAFIWPEVYGRPPLLNEEQIDALREIEETVGVTRILMYDSDLEAHWKRCVDNKEPLTKNQFSRARGLYSQLARKYNFEMVTLPKFLEQYPDAKDYASTEVRTVVVQNSGDNQTATEVDANKPNDSTLAKHPQSNKTPEQQKLERANIINEVLSKRILKSKGIVYDELEGEIREFLNSKLGKLLGTNTGGGGGATTNLSPDEVRFFKALYRNALNTKGE
jgi:hypothetical protein